MPSPQLSSLTLKLTLALACAVTAGAKAQGIPPALQIPPGGVPPKPSAATPMNVPATPTTTTIAPLSQAPPLPKKAPTHRARVNLANGLYTIQADNSSLNQVLREIARVSKIQITGGVTDERVYGNYGPANLETILATLLSGTGSNMMLAGDRPGDPQTLTLTPRQGGPTPPSPQSTPDDPANGADDLPPQLTPRVSNEPSAAPQQPVNPPQPQPFTPPAPQQATPAPAADSTTTQSPNGVKTPQQIYDELMKLQQQQPKPPQ